MVPTSGAMCAGLATKKKPLNKTGLYQKMRSQGR